MAPTQKVSYGDIGAFIMRIGFRGPIYYSYNNPQNRIGNYSGPLIVALVVILTDAVKWNPQEIIKAPIYSTMMNRSVEARAELQSARLATAAAIGEALRTDSLMEAWV